MNYSTAILLINPACRVIKAIYEPEIKDQKPPVRTMFKTFDETIAVDDLIMVPSKTRHFVTTCKVVETDVEWDPNTTDEICWVIGVINKREYDKLKSMEGEAIAMIKESEKTAARNKLRDQMMEHVNQTEINKLQIAQIGNSPAIETKS